MTNEFTLEHFPLFRLAITVSYLTRVPRMAVYPSSGMLYPAISTIVNIEVCEVLNKQFEV